MPKPDRGVRSRKCEHNQPRASRHRRGTPCINDSNEVVGDTDIISKLAGGALQRAFVYVNGTMYKLTFYLVGGPTVLLSDAFSAYSYLASYNTELPLSPATSVAAATSRAKHAPAQATQAALQSPPTRTRSR